MADVFGDFAPRPQRVADSFPTCHRLSGDRPQSDELRLTCTTTTGQEDHVNPIVASLVAVRGEAAGAAVGVNTVTAAAATGWSR
jgi:hypothetical protein